MTLKRLQTVAAHPEGKGALFTHKVYDEKTNNDATIVSFVSFPSNRVQTLLVNQGKQPFWLTSNLFGVLKEVNGTDQVFRKCILFLDILCII